MMVKTSRPAGQCLAATALLRGLIVVCCLFGLEGTANAAAARGLRQLTGSTKGTLKEFYFSEFMAESDEPVVLLEEGPFKLVASCQTISYSYSDWYTYYSSWYSSSSSYHHYTSHSPYSSSHSPYSTRTSYDSDSGKYNFDDDWYTDDYWQNGIHTESIAALELIFTADDSDYLFGSPTYVYYPFEEKIIGSYEAGESRTQIVFSGYDGSWSGESTLQSLSGYYITSNTIGLHIENIYYHGKPDDYSFPEGIDCMMSGVIGYVVP